MLAATWTRERGDGASTVAPPKTRRSAEASLATANPSSAPLRLVERLAEPTAEPAAEPAIVAWLLAREIAERARRRERRRRPPPGAARRPILGGVHPQFTSVELEIVEAGDCSLCFLIGREFHERESSRTAGLSIGADVHAHHTTRGRERLAQAILGRVEAQIPYEYFSWNGLILPWGKTNTAPHSSPSTIQQWACCGVQPAALESSPDRRYDVRAP
jgi:hypothetical protein